MTGFERIIRGDSMPRQREIIAGIVLGIAGFAGNWFKYPLFLNIDFLFGSFFVMVALVRFGTVAGITASIIAGSCTWVMWQHPYAVIIFTMETAFVGMLNRRRNNADILIHDIIYWLCIGAPLVWLFYHHLLIDSVASTVLIMLKQSLNGISNALLASILNLFILSREKIAARLPSYRQTVFTIMVTLVLLPAFIFIFSDLRTHMHQMDELLATQTSTSSVMAGSKVSAWLSDHHRTITALAERIGDPERKSHAEMQAVVETVRNSSPAFRSIGVFDKNATTVAFSPRIDGNGRSTIGVNFSDRPYLKELREKKRSLIAGVLPGVIANAPVVPLVSPIIVEGEFKGYCSGPLETDELLQDLRTIVGTMNMQITVLDQAGQVVVSTRRDLATMMRYHRSDEKVRQVTTDVTHLVPPPEQGRNLMQRWAKSWFVAERGLSDETRWKVIVENSYAPVLEGLQSDASASLAGLLLLTVLIVPLSYLLSHSVTRSLERLSSSTRSLPEDIRSNLPELMPESGIREVSELVDNFRVTRRVLKEQHDSLRDLNDMLQRAKREWERTFDSVPDLIAILDENHRILRVNRSMAQQLGMEPRECIGRHCHELIHGSIIPAAFCPHSKTLLDNLTNEVEVYEEALGGAFLVSTTPLQLDDGKVIGTVHVARDITDRKRAEKALQEAKEMLEEKVRERTSQLADTIFDLQREVIAREKAQESLKAEMLERVQVMESYRDQEKLLILQGRQAAMGEMIGNIAHQWRQPLNILGILLQQIELFYASGRFDAEFLGQSVKKGMGIIRHMSQTIDDFRDFFRPEKEVKRFSISKTIDSTIALISDSFVSHTITIDNYNESDVEVIGYQNEFSQSLLNILLNARDVLLERKIARPRISISVHREDDKGVIVIGDNGGGVPEEFISHIFDPYFTTKGDEKGTGLGLYMAKMIIEKKMGGVLTAINSMEGAEFRIVLDHSDD